MDGHLVRSADASAVRDVGRSVYQTWALFQESDHGFRQWASADEEVSLVARAMCRRQDARSQAAIPVGRVAADALVVAAVAALGAAHQWAGRVSASRGVVQRELQVSAQLREHLESLVLAA
jgi:hypothetical protein